MIILAATFTVAVPISARADDAAATATSTPPQQEDFPRPSMGLCAGFLAGGVAALAVGIGLGAAGQADANAQTGNTNNPPTYTPHLRNEYTNGESLADAGYAFMAIGGALLITDVILWIERYRKHPKKVEASLVAPPGTSMTKPTLSAAAGGLQVRF